MEADISWIGADDEPAAEPPFALKLTIEGVFDWDPEQTYDRQLDEDWLEWNGVYLLWPYLRSYVRQVVRLPHHGDPLVPDCADVWIAAIEHHFALVAARNFRALDLPPPMRVSVEPTLRDELIEGRNLHEHWPDNMPVFNVTPRVAQPPRRSGKDFAARNPDRGPYWWLDWSNKTGARLLPKSLLRRCMRYSMQSKPRSSATIPSLATACHHEHCLRGFTRTASGGRSPRTRKTRRVDRVDTATGGACRPRRHKGSILVVGPRLGRAGPKHAYFEIQLQLGGGVHAEVFMSGRSLSRRGKGATHVSDGRDRRDLRVAGVV